MSEQEQFDIINQPDYYNELKEKINAIRQGMEELQASAPEITTYVGGVVVIVSFISDREGRLQVGRTDANSGPIYDWTFPANWLAIGGQ